MNQHQPQRSAELVPNDHARLLVELLQPLGPELTRRWVAALLLVHREDREAVVREVEKRLAQLYPLDDLDRRASEPAKGAGTDIELKRTRRGGRRTA